MAMPVHRVRQTAMGFKSLELTFFSYGLNGIRVDYWKYAEPTTFISSSSIEPDIPIVYFFTDDLFSVIFIRIVQMVDYISQNFKHAVEDGGITNDIQ